METIPKELIQVGAEEWKSLLHASRTMEIFKVPMSMKDFATGLYYQYKFEVISRRGEEGWKEDDRVKYICLEIAKVLTDKSNTKFGIMLQGTNGIGKTTMANAFQKVVNTIAPQCWKDISGVMNKTSKDIVRAYGTPTYERMLNEPLLIIDDLGDETTEAVSYGNVSTPIIDLIEKRYNEQLFTFITTNLTPDQIQEKYGLRIRDRLKEMVAVVKIQSGSYR